MNLFTKQKQTQTQKKKLMVVKEGRWGRNKLEVWDKNTYTVLHIK